MLSTLHRGDPIETGKLNEKKEKIVKPDCVVDYNKNMAGIDRCCQLTSYYNPLRKTIKWYRKVIIHMIDVAATNSYILYRKVGGAHSQQWFRERLCAELTQIEHLTSNIRGPAHQHFLDQFQPTEETQSPRRRCVVCTKQGKRTNIKYFCKTCLAKPALCPVPCFEIYHKQL